MTSRLALAALLILAVPGSASAQQPAAPAGAHDSVMAVVKGLFDGMRTRDTALMRRSFAPGTVLGGVPAAGKPAEFLAVDAFIGSIAKAPAAMLLDERIYDPEVRIDGGLATVWTFYAFFVGDRLSHCGVDAFQLARTSGGWKIIALADTRQQTGCDVTGKRRA
ncbi:MAG: nuclear transport factor 2 family protein [Gemmatimonadetes bacterium]|nr:nuclear transport factor 2 family protein [Gemmatimonadota bacterium]